MKTRLFCTRPVRPLVIVLAALAVVTSVSLRAEDKDTAIRNAILLQIEAFANDDDEAAWTIASEGIKRRFGSSDVFLSMVREAYPAVHRASTIEFAERVPHGPFEIQVVRLQGPEGKRWDAYYRMVLIEGEWKVAGVRVQPAEMGI
ncbi:DUF4864 domain-containing protein [Marinobacter sp. M216]|uniref:DUF4864 domain-containing protein n=1 Tax=Marinobacter albus TaxID=3030833 RepID=A0ABT7HDD2_9GAMM|nr:MULTISPECIES: DUF4864 domain-containing protein [unclassified Marinobacter]MBW7471764.1 DUF4864 domain-containing protein [Marinobacter sp. F4218]MDK9558333.1 DUF4864 domain-containing protein [Marinobacter sp. M216]